MNNNENEIVKDIMPIQPKVQHKHEPYIGALILNPVKGVHDYLMSGDLDSFYPSTMLTINMGFENIITVNDLPYDYKNALMDIKHMFNVYDLISDEYKKFEYVVKNDKLMLVDGLGKKTIIKNTDSIVVMDANGNIVKRNSPNMVKPTDKLKFDVPIEYFNLLTMKNNDPMFVPSLKANIELLVDSNKVMKDVFNYFNKKYNYSMGANLVWFDKTYDTILYKILKYLREYRFNVKALMADLKREYELTKDQSILVKLAVLDIIQKAFKIGLNSGYGTVGSIYFRYYNRDLANAVTSTAQYILRTLVKHTNEFFKKLNKDDNVAVKYGNTDSIYFDINKIVNTLKAKKIYGSNKELAIDLLKFYDKAIHPMFERSFSESRAFLNTKYNYIGIKVEKIIQSAIISAKNRYSMKIIYDEGRYYETPKTSNVGISTNNVRYPKLMSKWFEKAIDIIFNGNISELIEYIDVKKKEFMKLTIDDVSTFESIKKSSKYILNFDKSEFTQNEINKLIDKGLLIDDNSEYVAKSGTSAVLKGVGFYNHLIKKLNLTKYGADKIKDGEKVKFIYLKPNLNRQGIDNGLCYKNELSEHAKKILFDYIKEYVDWDKQFEIVFLSSITKLTNSMGWDLTSNGIEKQKNVDDVFDFLGM